MDNTKKAILFMIVFSLLQGLALADYPVIVSSQGIDHERAKHLVYSVPEQEYRHIDRIDFISAPWMNKYSGYAWVLWDSNHNCYNGRIWIYEPFMDILEHELGHIYWHCELNMSIPWHDAAYNYYGMEDFEIE